jgi:hypothetical protein
VVKEKHANEKPSNVTNIVCKFFIDAVEKRQYGWFWKCPNGSDCKYRHALPPGGCLGGARPPNLRDVFDLTTCFVCWL